MHCVLHIGLEKTGTKTLQAFLNRNRARLAQQSILFPENPGRRNHRLLALLAYAPITRDDITALAQIDSAEDLVKVRSSLVADLQRELEARPSSTLLLSSEHFQSRLLNSDSISRFRQALEQLGCKRFSVLVYLRDPVEIACSLYASAVASGSSASAPPPPDNPYFRNICEHRATIERWSSAFGSAVLTPRLFDRSVLVGGSIIDDFCAASGIAIDASFSRPPDHNQAISALGLALLRRLNRTFPRVQNNRINRERGALADFVRRHYPGAPYRLTPEMAAAYRQRFSESDQWVRKQYFPERPVLFPPKPTTGPNPLCASETELDALSELVGALWKERKDSAARYSDH